MAHSEDEVTPPSAQRDDEEPSASPLTADQQAALSSDLRTAAAEYALAEGNQAHMLLAMQMAVRAVTTTFRHSPELAPLIDPLVAIVMGIDRLAQGAHDGILRPIKVGRKPKGGSAQWVVQYGAVLACRFLIMNGVDPGSANKEVARLLTKYSLPGGKKGSFSPDTVRDWRLESGRLGRLADMGLRIDAELALLKSSRDYSIKEAKTAADEMIAGLAEVPGLRKV
ncbi:hypothetical protein ACFOMD_01390 [Sphingoaurantiacus capsulatus]|uniref:Uncharacterized protein n=1 Tax=Sphingoaurantiacus capsulatus TaxID=1771310 RepID=A0ABV7X4X5_9SPHN